jgi:phytoene dehydrogenase-like protein
MATGVQLDSGEIIPADWVVSAADGHTTIHDLLGGKYTNPAFDKAFARYETFPSYLQVSLGIACDLSQQPGYLTIVLDNTIEVDPETRLQALSFRLFNYDPTFAPPGKTAVISCRRAISPSGRTCAATTRSAMRQRSIASRTPSSPSSTAGCPFSAPRSRPLTCRRPPR